MLSQQGRVRGRRVFDSFPPHSHEYLPVNRRAYTHPVAQPHAHKRVCLQGTFRISPRYSSCSRKSRRRAHVEVRFQLFLIRVSERADDTDQAFRSKHRLCMSWYSSLVTWTCYGAGFPSTTLP